MVIHVGAKPGQSLIAFYNTVTAVTVEIEINRVPNDNEDKIDNFYLGIEETINSPVECICILLDGYVKNETRKRYLEAAKNHGFKKAEIISIGKAELIELIKNVSLLNESESSDSDAKHYMIFHIFDNWITCAIWRKSKNNGFMFVSVEKHCKTNESTIADVKLFKQELQKVYKFSQVGFYDYKNEFTKDLLKPVFPEVNDIYFCTPKPWLSSTLLSACCLSGDLQYLKYRANEILEKNVTVKVNGVAEIGISKFTPLPLKVEKLIVNVNSERNIKVVFDAVGIDFGTSKCCVAVNRRNRVECVALENLGSRILPTYVTFDEKHEKCGQIAIDRMKQNSLFTVFDVKRILGNNFEDIQIDEMWPFKLKDINNKVFVEVKTFNGKKLLNPEEIASSFFKHIKIKVDEFQNENLTEAVITIPASYNDIQKQSIITAAKLAGWKIVYLLPEPIAAAFAYCDESALEINLNLLVFDLGGGTLDIFIVKTARCMLNVLSSNGSVFLGGRDFDTILIQYFNNVLIKNHGIEIMKNESKKYKFMADCQEVKNTLSYESEASLDVGNYDCNLEDFVSISREKFEQLSFPLLQKFEKITQEAVNKANMKNDEIDAVLYVGGGCKMPMIKNLLSKMFPVARHCCKVTPDEMVAEGACLYSCLLKCKYP